MPSNNPTYHTRFFNSIYVDRDTVTKRSANKSKIKREYSYYYLLPDHLKHWMVTPYNYLETDTYASYTMRRIPYPDLAFLWTHQQINKTTFTKILDKLFEYFNNRPSKLVDQSTHQNLLHKTYIDKVDSRISDLKFLPEYSQINQQIRQLTHYNDIDEIVSFYKSLYRQILSRHSLPNTICISHGDVCFSNLFYNAHLGTIQMIDPRGALNEEELWIEPYYDIAKLSHSICGHYDFFNAGLYSIQFHREPNLSIQSQSDNAIDVFKTYLEKNHFDYTVVRLFESSLFLSMLPLHIDNPAKVTGFILNAINILQELA